MSSLDSVLACVVPSDAGSPQCAIPVAEHVRSNLPELEAFLERLGDFAQLDEAEQHARLTALDRAGDPVFARLVNLAHEAFWADPRSWPLVGYTTRLPGRP